MLQYGFEMPSMVSPLKIAANAWVKEVRDMDAGPGHSRYVMKTCLLSGLFFSSSGMGASS